MLILHTESCKLYFTVSHLGNMSFSMYLDLLDAPAEEVRQSVHYDVGRPSHSHIVGKDPASPLQCSHALCDVIPHRPGCGISYTWDL